MALMDATRTQPEYDALQKDLYEIGEIPPLGHVPKQDVRLGDPPRTPWRA
jgi:crotonyl-CoA carboxylase/reductase